MTKYITLLILFIFSFLICYWTEEKNIDLLLEKVFFNTLSILIGLSIAIVGIFLGSINSLYLSLYKMMKKDGNQFSEDEITQIKTGLGEMIKELKENTFLSVYSLISIIILFVIKSIDFPYIKWCVESSIITKNFALNFFIIFISSLIFWSIVDSVKVIFKITNAFELVKR